MSEQDLLLTTPQRVNYYTGQFLTEIEFVAEQTYHRTCLQRTNMMLYEPGVVFTDMTPKSLEVIGRPGEKSVTVERGVALDSLGRQLVLSESRKVDLLEMADGIQSIIIYYDEQLVEPAKGGARGKTRCEEVPKVEACKEPSETSTGVKLATITLDGRGVIADCTDERTPVRTRMTRAQSTCAVFLPQRVQLREEVKKWMKLGDFKEKDPFVLHGTFASAPETGAQGCLAILIPPGARRLRSIYVYGQEIGGAIHIGLFRSGWSQGSGTCTINHILIRDLEPKDICQPMKAEVSLDAEEALVLFVIAESKAQIYSVRADFE